jgi:hypothetical protein
MRGFWSEMGVKEGEVLLSEGLVEEPDYYGEILALVVGWEDDAVFVFAWGGFGRLFGGHDFLEGLGEPIRL